MIVGMNRDEEMWIPQKLASNGTVTWRSFQADETRPNFARTWGATELGLMVLIDKEGTICNLLAHSELDDGSVVRAIEKLVGAP